MITHGHADHCVDIYGLHVMYRYGLEMSGLPVYTPEGLEKVLEGLVGTFGDTFDWRIVGDGDKATIGEAALRFSRTDHPPPTMASRSRTAASGSCTPPTRARSGASRRSVPGADLVLSEATYMHDDIQVPIHVSARQAGELAPRRARPGGC